MKKLLSLIIMAGATLSVMASPITPQQALARSMSSLKKAPGVGGSMEVENTPAYSYMTPMGSPVAYVFNRQDADGYVILAADDVAYPMLGYVDEGIFSEETMAPGLMWWLEEYGRQIEFANSMKASVAQKSPVSEQADEWVAVAPMLTTKWNQGNPYNLKCPKLNGDLCMTGCVATSMAQVMNYFKYPDVGEGSITYYPKTLNKKMILDFTKKEFKWDDMLDYYAPGNYTDEQADAVAYLMKACGFSTEMDYSPKVSSTHGRRIAQALRTYFKYDGNVCSVSRLPYSWNEWSEMIYENLKNIGPVVMNGSSQSGGHSFVCDGYDGKGYFHFNWGWGGISDGYFALDALNPNAQGIGGFAGGYNFNQTVILGIQKPTGKPVEERVARVLQYGATVGSINNGNLLFGLVESDVCCWSNEMDEEIEVRFAAKFESETDSQSVIVDGTLGNVQTVVLSPNTYVLAKNAKPTFQIPSLADGRYKVTLGTYDLHMEEVGWLPVLVEWGMPNFLYLNVADGKYTVEDAVIPNLEFKNVSLMTDLYMNCNFKLKAEVSNPYDIEIVQPVCPVLSIYGWLFYTGQSMVFVLNPGETKEVEWMSRFDLNSGQQFPAASEFNLGLINPQTNKLYLVGEEEMVYPYPGTLAFSLSTLTIADTPSAPVTIDNYLFNEVFTPKDINDFTLDLEFTVTKGYFDGELTIGLYEVVVTGQESYDLLPVGDAIYQDYPFIGVDQTYQHAQPMGIEKSNENKLYAVKVDYTTGMALNTLGVVFIMDNSGNGVDSVIGDERVIEYYNLQGVKVNNPQKGQMLIEKKGATIRKVIF